MTDYPRNFVVPTHINTTMRWSIGRLGRLLLVGMGITGISSYVANTVIYTPIMLDWPYNVRRMFMTTGSNPSGNFDIGLYTRSGARLWSSGSTASTVSATVPQYVTTSPDVLLQPGVPYFMALVHNQSLASCLTGSPGATMTASWGRACGLYTQAATFPLPLQATFAPYTAVGLPLMGFTNTASGF